MTIFGTCCTVSTVPPLSPVEDRARLIDLKNAIDQRDEPEVRQQLDSNASQITPDILHDLLDRACRNEQCSMSIKMLLAEHPKTNIQGALQLATERDNHSMRTVLQFVRRKAILYPSANSPRRNETDLDQALRAGHKDEARQLLEEACPQVIDDVSCVWGDAVRDNRVDIQRALLLLGYVDSKVCYRLQEDKTTVVQDAGVKEVMKEIPYYSPKRGEPENFNTGEQGLPVCRHFVADQLRKKVWDAKAKSNFDHYQSLDEVKGHVSAENGQCDLLKTHAKESYLIDNRKFGQFLAQQFEAMDHAGASTKLMLMESTNHAMELSLRIKEKDGKKVYVARFFDPNRTTTHARSASPSLQAFAFQDLREYLDGDATLNCYFPESKGVSILHVYPSKDKLYTMAFLPRGGADDRKLTGCIPDKEIDATAVWHLMEDGFAGELRRLKDEIERRPEAERITLLVAKDATGAPGLSMALQNGHADLVKAFGELLPLIPKEQWPELLAATRADGTPGLFLALMLEHANTVKAYEELLKSVPEAQRAELLAGVREALKKLLKSVPEEHRAPMYDTKIEAFKKLLPSLSPAD